MIIKIIVKQIIIITIQTQENVSYQIVEKDITNLISNAIMVVALKILHTGPELHKRIF